MVETATAEPEIRQYTIEVLGRTLEHLGVQNYKHRKVAIAELVANAWDAGATEVWVQVPEEAEYNRTESKITIRDRGSGMSPDAVQTDYLVVGRNRREAERELGEDGQEATRPIMGRKGIGKLAGFGLASTMTLLTWAEGNPPVELILKAGDLKTKDNSAGSIPIKGRIGVEAGADTPSGTVITLEQLRHSSPLEIEKLREALARRFSRRVRGVMKIYVNEQELGEPSLDLELRVPETDLETVTLADGNTVQCYYGFSRGVIPSTELRGFTIYVRGKTAQAPPFFFNVEGTASGQHGTKYVTGAIEADFIDEGSDDDGDVISTDRQEIDWEMETVQVLHKWGDELCRKILREWADRKGKQMVDLISEKQDFRQRIERLDKASQGQVTKFLQILGQAESEHEKSLELADALIRAYEFRTFHDVIGELESVADDPEQLTELLQRLNEWKVLESRAVLEIIKGRLSIIEKFHSMLVNDAPETAPKVGADNIHDLIAGYPWLLNADWQVLSEEKTLSKQLQEWNAADIDDEDDRLRYDFLALTDEKRLVIVEIKRSGHPVSIEDVQKLERYQARLSRANTPDIYMMLIYGGTLDLTKNTIASWDDRSDGELQPWNELYERTHRHYTHYKAVLEGSVDHADFQRKETEVAATRSVLEAGTSYRGKEKRAEGLGPQDTITPIETPEDEN